MLKIRKSSCVIYFVAIIHMSVFGQRVCLKIDSIKVNYLPWSFHSKMSVSEEDLLAIDIPNLMKTKVLKDTLAINEFCKIKLIDSTISRPYKTIDVRMLIKVFAESYTLTIAINERNMNYKISNYMYSWNKELIDWINKNVTPTK